MQHQRVKSSHIFSLAHEGDTLEARFMCGACGGSGKRPSAPAEDCKGCSGAGFAATYEYRGVPPELFKRVISAQSVGKEFNRLISSNIEGRKQ